MLIHHPLESQLLEGLGLRLNLIFGIIGTIFLSKLLYPNSNETRIINFGVMENLL